MQPAMKGVALCLVASSALASPAWTRLAVAGQAGPAHITFVNVYDNGSYAGAYLQLESDPNYYGLDASPSPVFHEMHQLLLTARASGDEVTINYSGYAKNGAYRITEVYLGTLH